MYMDWKRVIFRVALGAASFFFGLGMAHMSEGTHGTLNLFCDVAAGAGLIGSIVFACFAADAALDY